MKKTIFLFIVFSFILFFPSIFYAQMNSLDKFKMQQQGEQIKMKSEQFKNQLQNNSQETMAQSRELVQEKREEATQYQEKEAKSIDVFSKIAEKNEKPDYTHMMKLYGVPILLIMGIGIIFFIVWHQNL